MHCGCSCLPGSALTHGRIRKWRDEVLWCLSSPMASAWPSHGRWARTRLYNVRERQPWPIRPTSATQHTHPHKDWTCEARHRPVRPGLPFRRGSRVRHPCYTVTSGVSNRSANCSRSALRRMARRDRLIRLAESRLLRCALFTAAVLLARASLIFRSNSACVMAPATRSTYPTDYGYDLDHRKHGCMCRGTARRQPCPLGRRARGRVPGQCVQTRRILAA